MSASELSQVAVRDLYCTEVDRYAIETDNREGNPVHLAKLRQRIFEHTYKRVLECSPTISGESRIQTEYENGSQEHYFLPCPKCGHEQELLKDGFDWEAATYRCASCGEGSQQKVWRRLSTSQPNDAWDLATMTLILIESMKLRFDEKTTPDY